MFEKPKFPSKEEIEEMLKATEITEDLIQEGEDLMRQLAALKIEYEHFKLKRKSIGNNEQN
ncbi:MAG: hypothetical protein KME28_27495 [Pelatocladus maniniholoensis HA4357-MV3]|jgi:hypothetical protein|uniref:Uncharacterized protein n=1 Tax=Pelatocladus maniniholoensis HA4357-MV3 TaxID=1117104 RepID=A0A9E3HFJ8_9NOST|nr:hypothetical protein [Pelatocladus maniniholoensis HA4357-MV3]